VTRHRWRVLEAAIALVLARALLRVLPFARVAQLAGGVDTVLPSDEPGRRTTEPQALAVGRAIGAASRRLPGRSTCLVRALAGRLMLARRRIPSGLVLGVGSTDRAIHAHAWLVAGGGTVCGGREAPAFRPIAAFRS